MIRIMFVALLALVGCDPPPPSSDVVQQAQQERILQDGSSQVGMPAITHFRERKLMKDIMELRDQEGYVTYTYIFSEQTGKFSFFCQSIGFPIPYATQFTNPEKVAEGRANYGYAVLPQADPNGLFSPASAEGTWVMCKDPNGPDVGAVYVEPKLTTLPWPMPGVEMPSDSAPQ